MIKDVQGKCCPKLHEKLSFLRLVLSKNTKDVIERRITVYIVIIKSILYTGVVAADADVCFAYLYVCDFLARTVP